MINQDGTGRGRVSADCYPDGIQEDPFDLNRLVLFPGMVYLFQPLGKYWTLVYNEWPRCGTDFTGNDEKGLLAYRYRAPESIPEIRVIELPAGKVRDRFPILFACPVKHEPCEADNVEWWNFEMAWSPNGRYLAFAAALDGPSSDLYMYDAETGNVLRMTSGPDSVAQIWWSPDGKWIVMGELHESNYPFTTSLWAVSASNNELRQLYSLEDGYPQSILGWLDESTFIVFDGTGLNDALDLPAHNLDVVNIDAKTITPVFRGSFFTADFAANPGIIALGVYVTEQEGFEGDGTYLVSVSDPTPRLIGHDLYNPHWDEKLGLFITDRPCEDDPNGLLAFNDKVEWQCIYPFLSDSYPSPDGQWQVTIKDGTWLNTNGNQPTQVSQANAVQVIWRLDSRGFFYVENQILYYVSLPDGMVVVVDENVRGNSIHYQWLDVK
jgi:dipeptidyl aminopeptidase/acylaminoacyl peptidase